MSAEARTEDHRKFGEILSSTTAAIESAQGYLNLAIDASHGYDPEVVRQIRSQLTSLDAFMTELTQARTISDSALAAKAAGKLKLHIGGLQAVSDDVKRIASDVATPPGVGGYMEQTVTYIAQAVVLIKELP